MTKRQFIDCAIRAGLVPSAAVDDAESYDGGVTLHQLSVMWTAVCELKQGEPGCDATWQPVVDGPVIPCTLPKGHAGKHRAPEPFAQEDSLLGVTRGQMDYTTAVVGNAFDSGMTKEQFLTMVSIGWDARESTRRALNRGGE